eukprot:1333959-Rhodomonas_salina.1
MQDCPELVEATEAVWDAAQPDPLPALCQLELPASVPAAQPAQQVSSSGSPGLSPQAVVTLTRNLHGWIR